MNGILTKLYTRPHDDRFLGWPSLIRRFRSSTTVIYLLNKTISDEHPSYFRRAKMTMGDIILFIQFKLSLVSIQLFSVLTTKDFSQICFGMRSYLPAIVNSVQEYHFWCICAIFRTISSTGISTITASENSEHKCPLVIMRSTTIHHSNLMKSNDCFKVGFSTFEYRRKMLAKVGETCDGYK